MTTTITHTAQQVTVTEERSALLVPGLVAALVAAAATTVVAALAVAVGVDFVFPRDGDEAIPLMGFTQVTFILSMIGVLGAFAVRRWAARPARTFLCLAVALTALSLVPPSLVDADVSTRLTLVALHLLAAAIVVPVIVSRLDRP